MQESSMKSVSGYLMAGAVLTLAALAVWGIYAFNSQESTSMADAPATPTSEQMMPNADSGDSEIEIKDEDNEEMMMRSPQSTSQYTTYSEAEFAAADSKKRILFFHANWCPTCKVADAEFMANTSDLPADVVIYKVDYDSATQLKKKYGITYQHTFVLVDSQGEIVSRWNGGSTEEVLQEVM